MKLKILITTVLFYLSISLSGQRVVDIKIEEKLSAKKEYYDREFRGRTNVKANGYKPIQRQLHTESKHIVNGKIDNFSRRILEAYQKEEKRQEEVGKSIFGSIWEYYGADNLSHQAPIVTDPNGYISSGGWSPGVGRVNCIAFHPSNSNIFYAGTAYGGVWKTLDAGSSWFNVTNGLPNISISDIVIEESSPEKVYIVTGDFDGKYQPTLGVYKSYNGGGTWNSTGLSFGSDEVNYCGDIKINPKDPSEIYVACWDSLYFSSNYGSTFSGLYFGTYFDIEFHPTDSDSIYLAGATRISRGYQGNLTTLFDYGSCGNQYFRSEIAVTSHFPDVVGVASARVINCSNNWDKSFNNFIFSSDAGNSFRVRATSPNMMNSEIDGTGGGGQGEYDIDVEIVPTDTSTIYISGVNLWKSTDGGINWEIETHWDKRTSNKPYVHADIHDIAFNGGSKPYLCHDGGISVRHPILTSIYYDLTNDMGINQFYDIDIMRHDENVVIGALQDNGISYHGSSGNMKQVRGADGMATMFHHTDINTYYTCRQNGFLEVTSDNGVTWSNIDPSGINVNFVSDYVMHPSDSEIIFGAFDKLARTMDGGDSWDLFDNFPGSNTPLSFIEVGKDDPSVVYVAFTNFIYRIDSSLSTNVIWTNITNNLETSGDTLPITGITVNPADAQEVYVTCGGYISTKKVFKSTDGGSNWTNISSGLPNIPIYTLAYEDDSDDFLYAGTQLGVYYKNGNSNWINFNAGLPPVQVNDIEININTREMYIGTFGRGIWGRKLWNEDCPDHMTLTVANDNFPPGQTGIQNYNAQESIHSTRIIEGPNADILYNAQNLIILKPGFKAKLNSKFKTSLNSCN